MKTGIKFFLGFISIVAVLTVLEFGFGYLHIFKTKTLYKEIKVTEKKVDREVFEETQSYVEGKRQEALKFYKEYQSADETGKKAIAEMVSHSFANFDEKKLSGPLVKFVYHCKYK